MENSIELDVYPVPVQKMCQQSKKVVTGQSENLEFFFEKNEYDGLACIKNLLRQRLTLVRIL